jgi:hypothetical protein
VPRYGSSVGPTHNEKEGSKGVVKGKPALGKKIKVVAMLTMEEILVGRGVMDKR